MARRRAAKVCKSDNAFSSDPTRPRCLCRKNFIDDREVGGGGREGRGHTAFVDVDIVENFPSSDDLQLRFVLVTIASNTVTLIGGDRIRDAVHSIGR